MNPTRDDPLPAHLMPLQAVLFDLDGTLTDTEQIWAEVLDEVAAEHGGMLSPAAHAAMVGLPMEPSIGILHLEVGLQRDWRRTAQELMDRLEQRYRQPIPVRPGALQLLAAVREAGLRTALVTATERRLVELMLDTLGPGAFDVVVTGSDVRLVKPDPEPYLTALRSLGLTVEQAVAVEDSPHGVDSATAAGLTTVVAPSDVPVPAGIGRHFVRSLEAVDVPLLRSLPRPATAVSETAAPT